MNKRLKARIIELYGTQADFAAKLKVDDSLVSRVVRARRILTMADKKRWADALESTTSKLFYGEQEEGNIDS